MKLIKIEKNTVSSILELNGPFCKNISPFHPRCFVANLVTLTQWFWKDFYQI